MKVYRNDYEFYVRNIFFKFYTNWIIILQNKIQSENKDTKCVHTLLAVSISNISKLSTSFENEGLSLD